MTGKVVNDGEWMTLKAASLATGRTINSLRLLISRKKIDMVKKVKDNGPGYWLIHKEAMSQISMVDMPHEDTHHVTMSPGSQGTMSDTSQVISMPVGFYAQQQKDRDQALQGMMMYRYKFEELDRQVKLLPAPVETVSSILQQKDQALQEAREAIGKLEAELQQRALPWWKKLWRR